MGREITSGLRSTDDNAVMYLMAKKLGFARPQVQELKIENNVQVAETAARAKPRLAGDRSAVNPGASQDHMATDDFDIVTMRAERGTGQGRDIRPDPGHAGGTPESASGTQTLYNTKSAM